MRAAARLTARNRVGSPMPSYGARRGIEDAPRSSGEHRQQHGGRDMNNRVVRAIVIAPALVAILGGCVYRSRTVEKSTPSPVVMTPAPQQPVAVPTPPPATVPPTVTAPPASIPS